MTTALQGEVSKSLVPASMSITGMPQAQFDKQELFRSELERIMPNILAVLPRGVRGDAIAQMALTAALDNPKLLDCDPISMTRATLKMATLGLRVGETCDIVTIDGKKAECWIRVKGIVQLAMNSGSIRFAKDGIVVEGDIFEYEELAEGTHFRHVPRVAPTVENFTHMYAIYTLPDGKRVFEVWSRERLLAHKAQHVKGDKPGSAWRSNPLMMFSKIPVKNGLRFASLSPELRTALREGDEVEGQFEVVADTRDALALNAAQEATFAKLGAGTTTERDVSDLVEEADEFALATDTERVALIHLVNGIRIADMAPKTLAILKGNCEGKSERASVLAKCVAVEQYRARVAEQQALDGSNG